MKLRPLLTLCAALLALSPGHATAQTSAVPGFISYQGRVVDAAGANVGAGTPVNRTVIFRIWDNPSSTNTANLIYSEAQTVTVSEGEFSVLVGQGVANTTQTFGYSEAGADKKLVDLGTAFNGSPGSARYLGVTVAAAATIAATDNEITPRQQIVSTAFAMRSKVAESVDASAISSAMLATGAVGSTQLAAASVTNAKLGTDAVLATNIGNLNVTTAKLAELAVTTGKIADANVTTGKIANNAVDNTKLRDSAGLSVIGRKINSVGDPADIVAATDGHVLRRSGVSVDFGTVGTAGIADGAITGAKIASDANLTIGQLSINGRVMANSLEFWGAFPGAWGALFQKGATGSAGTNETAAAGETVLVGSPKLHLATGNGASATMTLSGKLVGIGRQPVTNLLEVDGNVSKSIAGSWLANSDRRIKTEIKPILGALEKLNEVRLVDFRYSDDYRASHPSIKDRRYPNVIAQEFAKVFPNDVNGSGERLPDGSEILQVDTYPLTIYTAAAVQQLKRETDAEIQALRDENATLRSELAAKEASLETRLIALERRMAKGVTTETVSLQTERGAK